MRFWSRTCNPSARRLASSELRRALGLPVRCMNLIVNSREPHTPVEHVWSEEEMERGWLAFEAARQLWVIEKGYDPTNYGTEPTQAALAA